MKIIILAAGRGSRLGARTKDRPKCMCTLLGRTLLDRALASIERAGFSRQDIGIVTGYKSEMFAVDHVHYFHNQHWESTNMFVSLTMADEWLKKEPCIVCYSDIVFSPHALQRLAACESNVAITYYTDFWSLWENRLSNPLEDLETFKLDAKGFLTEIGNKPQTREEIAGQYMGLIQFTPEGWAQVGKTIAAPLPKTVEKLDMTTLLNGMLAQGYPIRAIATDDLWLECDTESDLILYEEQYAHEIATLERL